MPQARQVVIAVMVVVSSRASAQPSGAQAEVLFKHGRARMEQRAYAQACAAFEASEKLEPSTGTLANLALCREKNLQFATAWGLYLQAERELRGLTDPNGIKLHDTMKARAAALEPKLSKLTITVPEASRVTGLEILRDNDRVEPGAWNQPLPIDGGVFKISARAPDLREWTTTITVRPEGDAQVVNIPMLSGADARVVEPEPIRVQAPAREVAPTLEPRSERASLRLPIGFGAAAVALGAGALGLELASRGTYSDAKASPDLGEQERLWKSANTRRYLAEGLGVAAIGCGGVAIYLYLRGRTEHPPTTARARTTVSPVATAGFTGFLLDGRW